MNRELIIAGIFSFVSGLISSNALAEDYKVPKAYSGLRNVVLMTTPEATGLKPRASEVWGILTETGYPEAVAILVAWLTGDRVYSFQ